MSGKPCTKPGKYGTLTQFAIDYGDRGAFGRPAEKIGTWRTWAYDADGAMDRFHDDEMEFDALSAPRVVRKC